MRFPQLVGLTSPAETLAIRVRNAESSATIPAGSPVCFVFNGTNDGVDVVLPATGGAARATSLFAGVTPLAVAAGALADTIVYGFVNNLRLVRATRAASTDAWASTPAIGVGDLLIPNTANNAFTFSATAAASAFLAGVIAGQTLASGTTLVSSSGGIGDTRLADVVALRAFVRAM